MTFTKNRGYKEKMKKISVIGLGFVGLTLAVTNAQKGFFTIGVDNKKEKINNLNKGKADFFEPDLTKYLKNSLKSKKIQFTSDTKKAIIKTDITFVTVGTPSLKSGKSDLSYIKKSLTEIRDILNNKNKIHLIAIKSTLTPQTTQKIILPIFKNLIVKNKLYLVVNPEFLREGYAIKDILEPHLIVIGEQDKKSGAILKKYYSEFYKNPPEIIRTDFTTAELIKYTNNAFLATKISFINSIANLCQKIPEVDVNKISYAIGKDKRIGSLFLQAGPGFGGSCLPKDLSGLINFSNQVGSSDLFFKAIKEVNNSQLKLIIGLMKKLNVLNKQKTISILGLAFKKNTDDIREAASEKLVKKLLSLGLKINVHDPMAIDNFREIFGSKITYYDKIMDCLKNSDCCIILTEWDDYKKLKQSDFIKIMKTKNVIDARRILDPIKFEKINFVALGLGKK
jgi:UDPglucose 6-dehydrogenase